MNVSWSLSWCLEKQLKKLNSKQVERQVGSELDEFGGPEFCRPKIGGVPHFRVSKIGGPPILGAQNWGDLFFVANKKLRSDKWDRKWGTKTCSVLAYWHYQ